MRPHPKKDRNSSHIFLSGSGLNVSEYTNKKLSQIISP